MIVNQYLQSGGSITELVDKYSISHKRHPQYNNLVLFKYSQIDSPFTEPLVCACRGLILDETDNWRVISHSFNKFFNYNEPLASGIDWSTAKVQEKYDGSLISMFWYDNQWQVATSGSPDAGGNVNDFNITFKDLFWKVWNGNRYLLPPESDKNITFTFELMCPENRVVVRHSEQKLVLIGARDIGLDQEIAVKLFAGYDWPYAIEHDLNTLADIECILPTLDPLTQEGYIVLDKDFNRIKIKSPKYVNLHHLLDGLNVKRILDIVRNNEISEVLAAFPEWQSKFNQISSIYTNLVLEVNDDYDSIKNIKSQKDFAFEAKNMTCPDALFKLRSHRYNSISDYFQSISLDSLIEMIDITNIT